MTSRARIRDLDRRSTARRPFYERRAEALAEALINRMADVMHRRRAETGACDRRDLQEAGFTTAQIDAYADTARSRAAARSAGEV